MGVAEVLNVLFFSSEAQGVSGFLGVAGYGRCQTVS